MKKSVFINPFVDRGFKILFGQESSKELLIELINDLLEGEHHVEDLSYMDKEDPSETTDGRGTVFDLLCKDQDGTFFIVELQNARQTYFYERALYYLCRTIVSQGDRGDWEFELVPVYGIFLLNFRSGKTDKVRTDLVIADRETGEQKSRNFREILHHLALRKMRPRHRQFRLPSRVEPRRRSRVGRLKSERAHRQAPRAFLSQFS